MGQWQLRGDDGKPLDEDLVGFDTAYDFVRSTVGTSAWKTVNGNGHMMTFNLITQSVVTVRVTQKTLPNGNVVHGTRP